MSQFERLLDRLQRGPITPMEAWKDAEMICLAIEKLRKEIVGG